MRILKDNIFYLLVAFVAINCSCEKYRLSKEKKLEITNPTSINLFYLIQYNFPDTTIVEESTIKKPSSRGRIAPNTTIVVKNPVAWQQRVETNSHKVMTVFFLSTDTVDKYSWETIRANYKIIKRVNFTLEELRSSKWKISY